MINGNETSIAIDTGSGSTEFIMNNDTFIYVVRLGSASGSQTFYPMICTKATWDISQNYVPYGNGSISDNEIDTLWV